MIEYQLGKSKYFVICIGFEARGSPHSFIRAIGAPKLLSENAKKYIE